MKFRVISDLVGRFLLLFSLSYCLPILTAMIYREPIEFTLLWFGLPMLICGGLGALLWYLGRWSTVMIRDREAFAAVAYGWLVIAFFGSLPFMLSGVIPDPWSAYFESMSGFTATGATVLSGSGGITAYFPYPHSIIIWRSLIQWLGGMGIIALSVVILARIMEGGMQLMRAEIPGGEVTRLKPKIAQTAAMLWKIYLLFTVAQIICLIVVGLTPFDAICQSFTTLAGGGYSPKIYSVEGYQNVWAEGITIVFMIIGATSFVLHYKALRGDFKPLLRDPEFRFYIFIIGLATLIITLNLYFSNIHTLPESIRHALFQVVSIQTTTGYSTTNFVTWPFMSQFILFILMFIGGCAGSTSGAIKSVRILVIFKALRRQIRQIIHPRAVLPIRLGDTVLTEGIVRASLVFFAAYIILLVVGTILLFPAMGANGDIVSTITAVATSLGNVGPGLGTVGPYANFAFIHPTGKMLLAFCMWFGRLEIMTGLIILLPSSYRD